MVSNKELEKQLSAPIINALTDIVVKEMLAGRGETIRALRQIKDLFAEYIEEYMESGEHNGVSIIGIMGIKPSDRDFATEVREALKQDPINTIRKDSAGAIKGLLLTFASNDLINQLSNSSKFTGLPWKEGSPGDPGPSESWFFRLVHGIINTNYHPIALSNVSADRAANSRSGEGIEMRKAASPDDLPPNKKLIIDFFDKHKQTFELLLARGFERDLEAASRKVTL